MGCCVFYDDRWKAIWEKIDCPPEWLLSDKRKEEKAMEALKEYLSEDRVKYMEGYIDGRF
jgi:hypothetical protein